MKNLYNIKSKCNIKMDLRETGRVGRDWIDLSQDKTRGELL
jgi:hypothetical protein